MSTVQLLWNNYLDLTSINATSVSSEDILFPASNVYFGKRRSRVWRSKGYWNIAGGSNTIVFRETVGVDLTATITAAEYTSTTTFLAAIKTAMQAVGSSTYTVSQDATTKKIKIVSSGTGGGGVFQLRLTAAGSAAMAAVLGFSTAADLTGSLTYTASLLRIHTSEWFKWDMGQTVNPSAFVLVGDRNAAIQLSPTALVKLQGNATDSWTSPVYEATLTYNDVSITTVQTTGLHTAGLRYWRLYIEDKDNTDGFVEISSLYLGDAFAPSRGGVQFPFKTKMRDRSTQITTFGGQILSDPNSKTQQVTLEWNGLTIADKESLVDIWEDMGLSYPFFVSLDPNGAFSSSANKSTLMCRFYQEPTTELASPGNFRMTTELVEEI